MTTSIKWAAELAHVREVSLLGTADLAFWKEQLLKEDLLPAERDGQAQILIIAASAKYMGVRFQELSFSVLVSRVKEGNRQDAAYLLRAFNSSRLFAFCGSTRAGSSGMPNSSAIRRRGSCLSGNPNERPETPEYPRELRSVHFPGMLRRRLQ
jgi:hypothetical protein